MNTQSLQVENIEKLYFTDPAKAAWMMEKFGVEIKHPSGGLFSLQLLLRHVGAEYHPIKRFYVYPGSLHIFKFQKDDLIRHNDHYYPYQKYDAEREHHVMGYPMSLDTRVHNDYMSELEIKERNNIVFFMAEVEA